MPRLECAASFSLFFALATSFTSGCDGGDENHLGQTGPSAAGGAGSSGGAGQGGADIRDPGARQGDAGAGGEAGGAASGAGGACVLPDPAPFCPLGIPEPGTTCTTPQTCNHITALCFGIGISTCVTTSCGVGAWKLELPACHASGACALLKEAACGATSYCRWLTPGCSENPLPSAGCFAKEPCLSKEDCHAGTACMASAYDPCAGKGCQACGSETTVCR